MNRTWPRLLAALSLVLALASCSRNSVTPDRAGPADDPESEHQPPALDEGCGDLPVAPDSLRVDLIPPVFSNPTAIGNPLFPAGELERALFIGIVEGERLRTETTLMPGTRTITVEGEEIEVVVSQYVAWLDRRIHEVALDWYAEDDDGNAWYLGEDVFNYEGGVIVDTEGTWIAGVDGPPAMIMPADPQVGDVWRPENACPLVFEEVTALETGVTVDGPQGPVSGALRIRELHMDGTTEEKTFAPGYGEFFTGSETEFEAMALAIPTNALPGEPPEELEELSEGAEEIFRLARNGRWGAIGSLFEEMQDAWAEYEATGVPPRIAESMTEAMDSLEETIDARDRAETRQASVDVAFAALDFELQYEDRAEIDLDLIGLWTRQLQIDLRLHDHEGVLSDLATIDRIRDRLSEDKAGPLQADLRLLRSASLAGDEEALARAAARIAEGDRTQIGVAAR